VSSEARSQIMARVRGTCRGQGAESIGRELAGLGGAPAAPLPHEDTVVAFMANVLRNHGTLDLARDRREVVKAVGQYLYRHLRSHRLVAGNDPHLAAMPWRDGGVLPRFGSLEAGEPAALSYAPWGVAETGATVMISGRQSPAANFLLPEHHLVLVEESHILPDLDRLWQALGPQLESGDRPRGITFVAGPSSTADIEAQLVYGAHGPQAWHVIILGDVAQQALDAASSLAEIFPGPGGY